RSRRRWYRRGADYSGEQHRGLPLASASCSTSQALPTNSFHLWKRARSGRATDCDMPPLILWALGMAGAAIIGRVLYRESQRINAQLHPEGEPGNERKTARTLERDPKTGVYRPK